ncbi:S-layer homology domain-containing protein [Lysinibacillus telephonicus]|uniref:S-layer homology domain-containing protein n=2 Tax=Lysinibacillus telephonicus TaxID=1714840 RepID=A0A431UXB7_9BACI|nr:S-layer homology domain-containing protein [Lysinibacillus telephonicus]RTQ96075.1 S-layer homology domain-containing protein [Lysinibacillus telephonicus]
MKKFIIKLLVTFIIIFSVAGTTASAENIEEKSTDIGLLDIPNTYWAKNEIFQLMELGIIEADRDLQFRPDVVITKGEAAIALAKALKLPDIPFNPIYNDITEETKDASKILAALEIDLVPSNSENVFGLNDKMTREQFAYALIQAFKLEAINEEIVISDQAAINDNFKEAVQIALQHKLLFTNNGEFKPSNSVKRVEFASALYKALVLTGKISGEEYEYKLQNIETSKNFSIIPSEVNLIKLSFDEHPIYIRSKDELIYTGHERIDNGFSRDNIYTYSVAQDAKLTVTVRSFDNGDYFLFSQLVNPNSKTVIVDILQKENDVVDFSLARFDNYPIKRSDTSKGTDITSYPTGLLSYVKDDGSVEERMVGKAYNSKQLTLDYEDGGKSTMRSLLSETEVLSYAKIGSTLMSVYRLQSVGNDIVDHWYVDSSHPLFKSDLNRESWMQETARYFKKRNNWYTADGPYNKMVSTTEPMPESGLGYGRSLLLVKEDRALTLYKNQQDRYFENLVYNSFVNLQNFKMGKEYWQTEVTSTYLKSLYNITAPFIDTRFNEQIALFYYNSGELFNIPNYKEPLRNYADLLVSRKEEGHIIQVDNNSYYISDYFPVNQKVTTHSSMNHVLGGMNILLMAYLEFGDEKYLETARAIQTAIERDQDKWIRDNGDIWYKISPEYEFVGDDYKHLTLEDLIQSYKLWSQVDKTYLPTIEKLIASKASYLSNENLGYTTKIYNGLNDIGLLKYLPEGPEQTDAL